MIQTETPKIVKKKLFSPVWLLPAIALLLGVWLIIKSVHDAGVEITIHFPNATGIEIGKTLVKYQGVNVGKVTDIAIDKGLKGVQVTVNMNYRGAPFLNDNTQFWLVSPKASITKIEGLDTLFSGNYIAIKPGDGDKRLTFNASLEAPPTMPASEGMLLKLTADDLGSLDIGSHVFYRQIPVGNVVSFRLENQNQVSISLFIKKQYAYLIKQNTRFWNISGVKLDASLSGVKLETGSLASLIAGGITFNSPTLAKQAKSGDTFILFDSKDDALDGASFSLVTNNADGIPITANIMYRGVKVGRLVSRELTEQQVRLSAELSSKYSSLLTANTQFWIEGADLSLSGVKNAQRLLTGSVIQLLPGAGKAKNVYPLQTKAPDLASDKKVSIKLIAPSNFGLSLGSVIKYKGIEIGNISQLQLSPTLDHVDFTAEINPEFSPLLNDSSYFVPQAAVEVNASLDNVSIKTNDLKSSITGSLNLVTRVNAAEKHAETYTIFASNAAAEKATAALNSVQVSLRSANAANLQVGSPVYYKKMHIGQVDDINWLAGSDSFAINLSINKSYASLISRRSVFWQNNAAQIKAGLSGVDIKVTPLKGALKGSVSLGLLSHTPETKSELLYDDEVMAVNQAKPIKLTLAATSRITDNAAIKYLGFKIGEIRKISLDADLKNITASAYLYGQYSAPFMRNDSHYSLVDAQLSLAGIKAPETLLTGAYINASSGKSTTQKTQFTVSNNNASALVPEHAVIISLIKSELGSITVGTKLFFRGINIGQVDSYQLSKNGDEVIIKAHITSKYLPFVNTSSRFAERSGIKIDAGIFSGVQVDTGSIENILVGGIAVTSEAKTDKANAIKNGDQFILN
ncbi:MAG: MlaD family protein [Parashewanella sp.]